VGVRTRGAVLVVAATAAALLAGTGGTAVGADAGGRGRGEPARCPAPGELAPGAPADADTLWRWTRQMASFNFRHTGSVTHRRYLAAVERRLRSWRLDVTRYPTPLDYWEARSWSLRVTDAAGRRHHVPVAWYRPYSGETTPRGVTAAVADIGAGRAPDYERADVRGKIVLADLAIPPFTVGGLAPLTLFAKDPAPPDEDYARMPSQGMAPDLGLAKRHGAVAMITVIDRSPAEARGQFYPHQQTHAGLPAVHLDRVQGARLRSLLAAGPVTATLVLTAVRKLAAVDYLAAELPGSGELDGALLLLTHSDGQNALEENGVPAVLAMTRYLAGLPRRCRPRDVVVLFSGTHMASPQAAVHADAFLERHPEIRTRVRAAFVPEHLGATDWTEDRATGTYRPAGRSELAVAAVGNSASLTRLTIDEVARSDLSRTHVLAPFNGLYGEGTGPYRLGIPTVAFITGPTYLLQVAPDGNLHKLDRDLMHRQTVVLTRILTRMLAWREDTGGGGGGGARGPGGSAPSQGR
jgi:subtilisin family serine protease